MAWDDDPDAVARELNELAPAGEAPALPPQIVRLDAWLRELVARKGEAMLRAPHADELEKALAAAGGNETG